MMVLTKETVTLAVIDVAIKAAVTVGFLKNHIARILLVSKNGVYGSRTPLAILFGF